MLKAKLECKYIGNIPWDDGQVGIIDLSTVHVESGSLGGGDVDRSFAVATEEMVEGQDHLELAAIGDGKRFILRSSCQLAGT